MTKNFQILREKNFLNDQVEIIENISKIENAIIENNYDWPIYVLGRKILESILFSYGRPNDNLAAKIKTLTFEELPPIVSNAMNSIRKKANQDSHSNSLEDRLYAAKNNYASTVDFLQQIYINIAYFFRKNFEDSSLIDDYPFDPDAYKQYLKDDQQIEEDKPEIYAISSRSLAMNTEIKGLFEIINSQYKFLIPTYQREYTWTEEQVDTLIQDIKDRQHDQKNHYMGTIAIAVDNDKKILRLIDGQQRITTTLLLVKAIIKKFSILEAKQVTKTPKMLLALKDELKNKYVSNNKRFGSIFSIIKVLNDFIGNEPDVINSRAFLNYQTITNELAKMEDEEFVQFANTFIYAFKVTELRINDDLEMEIQIFENLNSKGLELTQWDLIKNYIFKKIDFNLLNEKEKEIEQIINHLFILKSSIAFGNENKSNRLNHFFAIFCRIKYKLLHGEALQIRDKVYKTFGKLWPEKEHKLDTIINFEDSLLFIARCFEIYCLIESKNNYLKVDSPLYDLKFDILNMPAKDAHLPLLINLLVANAIWEEDQLVAFDQEKIMSIHRLIVDLNKYLIRLTTVNGYNSSITLFFDRLIENDVELIQQNFTMQIKNKGVFYSLPTISDFAREFKDNQAWKKENVISVFRIYLAKDLVNDNLARESLLDLMPVQIFPEKVEKQSFWYEEWSANERSNHSFNNFKRRQVQKIQKIGNFIPLPNTKIWKKNKTFSENITKVKLAERNLLIAGQEIEDNEKLMNLTIRESFTFREIDKRSEQLANLIVPYLKLSHER